jgi:DnaK suppressor protein
MPNDLNISTCKTHLEKEREELLALDEISREAAETVELDQSKVGRLSRMDALQQQAMQKEQNRRRAMRIEHIKTALERIKMDDYGWCLDCGEPINPQRLAINPAVEYCTQCADNH